MRPTRPTIATHSPPTGRFDWTTIGAEIIRRDDKGATRVLWGGYLWTRRNDAGRQYGKAIWFSRIDSGSDRDDLTYIRLITFKNSAEPTPCASSTVPDRPTALSPNRPHLCRAAPKQPHPYHPHNGSTLPGKRLRCLNWTPASTTPIPIGGKTLSM